MKRLNQLLLVAGALFAFHFTAGNLAAQPAPGQMTFDPQQMQQRMQQMMMDAVRDRLSITNDEEWKVIESRLSKVMQLRTEALMSSVGGFGGMRMGGNRAGGDNADGGQRRMPNFGPPNPEADALQKSLDANAPVAELRAKMNQLREARKQKQAALARAQDELRKVLSVPQEATLMIMGQLE
jgi:hypothetical protein